MLWTLDVRAHPVHFFCSFFFFLQEFRKIQFPTFSKFCFIKIIGFLKIPRKYVKEQTIWFQMLHGIFSFFHRIHFKIYILMGTSIYIFPFLFTNLPASPFTFTYLMYLSSSSSFLSTCFSFSQIVSSFDIYLLLQNPLMYFLVVLYM